MQVRRRFNVMSRMLAWVLTMATILSCLSGLIVIEAGAITKTSDYLVITGEGKLDGQSAMGKAPVGVAMLGKKHQKPVIAIAGSLGADAHTCTRYGITRYYASAPEGMPLSQAMDPRIAFESLKNILNILVL